MVEFPQWNNFGSYFSDKSEKKVFINFQVYLSLSSDQEKFSVGTVFSVCCCVLCRRKPPTKTRNLQRKTRNLQKNKKPPTENRKQPTDNKKPPTSFMSWYMVEYGQESQTKVGAERANLGLFEAVFGLFVKFLVSSKFLSECCSFDCFCVWLFTFCSVNNVARS